MFSTKYIVFMEVAVHKSFSKAVQTLFISQPAISKHIQSLELHYKTKLFERNHNSIELTTAGKLLYEQLLQVKVLQDRIEFDLSSLSGRNDAKGFLKLGASIACRRYNTCLNIQFACFRNCHAYAPCLKRPGRIYAFIF